ncbi:trypsin [Kitasatospora sp. SolWspMP-SS2h]|uniref:carbohydrate-binding protein n=1 Tax=Kitasatospora sp. SolWspMP-SS2h TaxID=1305729 RepID=UPI000DBA8E78|nr:carbohydrate-binding protein [Kitasatospora sp. SolWspMP-SS2h]RAJ29837.1 trypsin [Kitasatospora sp. SolWspMP-SS2h]
MSTKAMAVDTTVVDDAKCPVIHNGNAELCNDDPGNTGACYGDSGGPEFLRAATGPWVLVGVGNGWGTANTDCGAAPSVYADVTEKGGVRQWIAQTVGGLPDAPTGPTSSSSPSPSASTSPRPSTSPSGSTCTAAPWSASAVYAGGSEVSYNGRKWKAKWWTTNEKPGAAGDWGVWQDGGTC